MPRAPIQRRTAEEDEVLTMFARNYRLGRHVLCFLAKGLAGFGAVAAFLHAFWNDIVWLLGALRPFRG